MSSFATPLEAAEHRVENAREAVARLEARVASIHTNGGDAKIVEEMLATFKEALAVFEADVQRLQTNQPRRAKA